MALNFVHGGLSPVPLALLGRSPNEIHKAIYKRLRALLAACDRPECHPMPPGRSGPEFIAKLVELEHFASSCEGLGKDAYFGASDNGPVLQHDVGRISSEHRFKSDERFSPVHPYRSLDADRLKISGTGQWPMSDFLTSILWLPFQEPAVLLHGGDINWPGPDFKHESREECLKLAKIWDQRGLLALFHEGHQSGLACRVFNAHKSSEVDRQIGDRRWLNGAERHPTGPSAFLPAGQFMTSVFCPLSCKLVGCASDRKDYYHQARVSRERAITNVLPFSFPVGEFEGSSALAELYAEVSRPASRETDGDRYGLGPRSVLAPSSIQNVFAGFKSLFQGDHLGVEYALESHCNLLEDVGLLDEDSTVLRHSPFPPGPLWQGVVIDDYFCLSREPASLPNAQAKSVQCLNVAEKAYSDQKVAGSDDKTIRGEEVFKLIGAEVISDAQARSAGVITIGAPASKRVPLICLSAKVAALPVISRALASRIAGNWISVFMFRRPLCCLLSETFGFGSQTSTDEDEVLLQPRKLAEELLLSSIFGLIAVSDVSVGYDEKIYASDASMTKGAYTSKRIGVDVATTLWLGGDKKGSYTLLDNPARSQLRTLGIDVDREAIAEDFPSPQRSLDFAFDAVEICGGSGVLSKALAGEGLTVCPPIDLASSRHYDLKDLRLIEWIFDMIASKRFKCVIVEPVCRTFSPAQHPSSRSYACPLGFDRADPKTWLGNLIAFRCLAILWYAMRHDVIGLAEQPRLSKMAWLSIWQFLLSIGFEEAFVDSCAFGCIHKKPFRFLGYGINMKSLSTKCPGGHQHVRIEGKYTKDSAVYHPGLAAFLAAKIAEALRSREPDPQPKKVCIESVVLNDILSHDGWSVGAEWEWSKPAHINILESRSVIEIFRDVTIQGGDRRLSILLDSRVAKGAHAKGRSSALSLRPSLLRACAYTIRGNLYPSYGFAPTRLNTADAPTRDRDLPQASKISILDFLSQKQIAALHSHQFSRATAGWIRLFILLVFCTCPGESCRTSLPAESSLDGFWTFHLVPLGFFILFCTAFLPHWTCNWNGYPVSKPLKLAWVLLVFPVVGFGFLPCARAMPLQPTGTGETMRAHRRAGNVLQADRVILQQTRQRRDVLLQAFDEWLVANWRVTLEELVGRQYVDFEEVAEALVSYGKDMYQSGKSYGKFSETINAVTSRRPALRRNLAAAWDLAFNWAVDEPHEHHAALPLSVMLALTTLGLLWGWARESAIIALAFTGVLRIGEVISARRADLVLPQDTAPGFEAAMLLIKQPKTRGRAARHQSTRVDPCDIVALLAAVYGSCARDEPLWPFSPATLRRRFAQLQIALGLVKGPGGQPIYSLSSLRPGGATFWLQLTEDAEYVRRKGRWISTKVLEVYLQEASVVTYETKLTDVSKSRIDALCKQFLTVLCKVQFFQRTHIPSSA